MCVGEGVPSAAAWDGKEREHIQEGVAAGVLVDGQVSTEVVNASSESTAVVDGACSRIDVDTHSMYIKH